MHKLESILANKMHKFLWDFKIQMDHLILARRADLLMINKKKRKPAEHWTLPSQQTTE